MRIALSFSVLLYTCGSIASAHMVDDKEKADKIRKEIAELRAQLTEKEAELVRVSPAKMVEYLWLNKLETGTAGRFGDTIRYASGKTDNITGSLRVDKLIDKNTVIVSQMIRQGAKVVAAPKQILISNCDTTGLSDGTVVESGTFRVLGTKTIDGKTYAHVEPYMSPKK